MSTFSPLASWNGAIGPLAELKIPATDRGFFFGDGVYEVIRLYQGKPFLLAEHLNRLSHCLEEVRIRYPLENVRRNLSALLEQFPKENGLLYLHITRGSPPLRNHLFPENTAPNEMMYVTALSDPQAHFRKSGINVILAEDTRWHRPDIKSLNLLPNVLIRQEAQEKGAQEAILERWDGRITEATSSNCFIVLDGTVITPRSDHWILGGISRQFIHLLCEKNGIAFREVEIRRSDLFAADEVFLSSTTCEVIAVTQINGKKIKDGMPGPVSQNLYRLFQLEIQHWLKGS